MLPRSAWTHVPRPVGKLTRLDPREVRGIAVHWPGSKGRFGRYTQAQTARLIEGERRLHVSGRGWVDVAYGAAVDLSGRVWDLRGAEYRSAANGDETQNRHYGAVTVLAGVGEPITPEAVEGVRWWREHVWLPLFPRATEVVGHRDLHGTECPGPELYRLIKSGAFTAPSTREDDMPSLDEISAEVWGPQSSFVIPVTGKGDVVLKDGRQAIAPITALKRILAAVEAGNDPAALGAAIAKHLPPTSGVDPAEFTAAVAAELAARLAD